MKSVRLRTRQDTSGSGNKRTSQVGRLSFWGCVFSESRGLTVRSMGVLGLEDDKKAHEISDVPIHG